MNPLSTIGFSNSVDEMNFGNVENLKICSVHKILSQEKH